VHPCPDGAWQAYLQELLAYPALIELLNTRFLSFGMFQNSPDTVLLEKFIPFQRWPCFAVVDCAEEPRVVSLAPISKHHSPEQVLAVLTGKEQTLPELVNKESEEDWPP
jgi:hypothetical protein